MRSSHRVLSMAAALCLLSLPGVAQWRRPLPRIPRHIDESRTVMLSGNRHPLAQPEYDTGPASPEIPLDRMLLVLKPDAEAAQALAAFLEARRDPGSPDYERSLTPAEFGERFGVALEDVERVAGWLRSHGFTVETPPESRRLIVFSGTAAQVEAAFHTRIHLYRRDGEMHYANSADPEVPAALAEVIGGVASLHDFRTRTLHRLAPWEGRVATDDTSTEYSSGATHYMSPADFATIYDVAPLYAAGITGSGQSIAVAGRSNIVLADVQAFRARFGLPANNPAIVVNGTNPGVVSGDEQAEAELDVEWAGAVAKNASIQFVVSKSGGSTDGVFLSMEYIVNHNLAPVVSVSFGACEAALGAAGNQLINSLWQQAAAQGMTVLVASGDSGAAGCDAPGARTATAGAAVNGLCSTPYSTCVGGTQFSDASNAAAYWSPSNNVTTSASALSYIPEAVWNSSGIMPGGSQLWAGGGGLSSVYAKPAWQTGAGVPADSRRAVPDVSLNASTHDGYFIDVNGQYYTAGGTSASTPAFAGLMALAVQKAGKRLGNVNPALYALAAAQAGGTPAVFHDIASGSNSVPGLTGRNAGIGYDAATGLGSVDAAQWINRWQGTPALALNSSAASVSLNQGAAARVTLSVAIGSGFNAAVALSTGTLPGGLSAAFSPAAFGAPGSGSATLTLAADAKTAAGSYNVALTARGGGISQTISIAVTVMAACTYAIDAAKGSVPATAGNYFVNVTSPNGCSWTAKSNVAWLAIFSGFTATANGKVGYAVSPNNSVAARTGTLTIAGLTFTLTQAAGAPAFSLSPTTASVPAAGGSGTVALGASPPNATWSASSNAAWLAIATGGTAGSGPKTIAYTTTANPGSAARTGALTIAGLTFTVTQAGQPPCTYSIGSGATQYTPSGATASIAVTTTSGCKWTASSNVSWMKINSGSSGAGSGTVVYALTSNAGSTSRNGTLTVAGHSIAVTQAALPAR